ncbi:hypothetical protein [Hymenobacter sp. BRD67]|uniref:hypothetical protein n=1 Tax=Hymenobacter sp. BRD67 TaxID=2675877 RepID=UPI001566CC75|nr:hypothetical protein [Hymenobacter sp. BRD67]QKG52856.1 hypothetical protein GKZ67_09880 [Hymenobacter sp. BRD67]
MGSYREYDSNNGTYENIQVNGNWVSPYYYSTVKVYNNTKAEFTGAYSPAYLSPIVVPAVGEFETVPGVNVLVSAAIIAVAAYDTYQATKYYGPKLARKMNREIDRINAKAAALGQPGQVYRLEATNPIPGTYIDVRGKPVTLQDGSLWKYGQTTTNSRYSDPDLYREAPGAGLQQVPIFYGTQAQCLILEKFAIYGYYFKNGELPPGNRIFR